jgi:SHS2 domain-containing protein
MRHPLPGAPPLYHEIDHTADCGVVIEATTPEELFEKGALALCAIMVDPQGVDAKEERVAAAEAENWEDLFHHWLAELLAVFTTDAFLAAEVTVTAVGPHRVQARLRGERFDESKHEFRGEVKAVTYHELQVVRTHAGWRARVILDV